MTTEPANQSKPNGPAFLERPAHRNWLHSQAISLLEFYQYAAFNPAGGFYALDGRGQPLPGADGGPQNLHDTARMIHSFAIGHSLGLPDAARNIDHGMAFLWTQHRDPKNGGYFTQVNNAGPLNTDKQAYRHAFVLLAAASAKVAGHPDADRLLEDVSTILDAHFWDDTIGATREDFSADWQEIDRYRGQNSNMHLCEATMAAYEATGDSTYLLMAERIADLIINQHAANLQWRVAEHFDADWQVDPEYQGDPEFRPPGTTPGHALEWARLLVQLWTLGGRKHAWMKSAAIQLFHKASQTGWDPKDGGFFYTLDWDDAPAQKHKFWWPCAEGIAAAAVLARVEDDPVYEHWYRRIWGYTNRSFIDHKRGGWWPESDPTMKTKGHVFTGKPDIYHALQACLIPMYPETSNLPYGLIHRSA